MTAPSPVPGSADLPQILIRTATDDDLDAARGLLRAYKAEMRADICFADFESELTRLGVEYGPPEGALLLAFDRSPPGLPAPHDPVGCVALHAIASEDPARRLCEMKRLYVRPQARGRRIGLALASRIISIARDQRYHAMRLDTLPFMRDAIAMYRRLGFREIPPYRHNPVAGVLFFELDLCAQRHAGADATMRP